jgi:hypothetical protein
MPSYTPPGYVAPPPAPAPAYPDLYILKVDDLVEGFIFEWDRIITNEIMTTPVPMESEVVFPEVYTIAPDGSLHKSVYLAQHVSERAAPWHPDISMVVCAALESIKAKRDIEQDPSLTLGTLWVDVVQMADIQIRSNICESVVPAAISSARQHIARLAMSFGKQLYQRLVEYGLYKNGTFPYHYIGWEGDCAIVALDDDPQVEICTM